MLLLLTAKVSVLKNINKEIGYKIKKLRQSLGLSQISLAEKIGLSFQQIQKYEKGQTKITISRLFQIAGALNVPIHNFIDEDEFPKMVSDHTVPYGRDKIDKRHSHLLSREEVIFLKRYNKIKSPTARQGLMKIMKSIVELEKKK